MWSNKRCKGLRPKRTTSQQRIGHEHGKQIRLDRGGRVTVWQPPERVAFSFHPGRDAREAQTVEVTFSADPEGTRVVLLHSGWEKLNANAQEARDSYNRGWEGVFVSASANT
jgi:uncharacterized protein YndB with AHSA1/START domain